jgi:hypothetical protein
VPLVGPATVEVPAQNVTLPDQTGTTLVVTIEQGSVAPGTYDVVVIDPDGHAGTLPGGLVIDPPPDRVHQRDGLGRRLRDGRVLTSDRRGSSAISARPPGIVTKMRFLPGRRVRKRPIG